MTKTFFEKIYNSENHTEYDINTIKSHASITNVKSKPVGVKENSTFRVTVYFSDGFKYIAHDSVVIDCNFANFTMALTSAEKNKFYLMQSKLIQILQKTKTLTLLILYQLKSSKK